MTIEAQERAARAQCLGRYDILHTAPEEAFDRLTRLVRSVLDVPTAMLALVDGEGLWLKSRQGMAASSTFTAASFSDLVVQGGRPLLVSEALDDKRFRADPAVLGAPFVRFYAGVPLRARDGQVIGVLCATDSTPRTMGPQALDALTDLGRIVMTELEYRRTASIDALTGILSARAFGSEAARAFGFARRHRSPLSCITFDLGGLDTINDLHGRAARDRVLVGTVAAAEAVLRTGDRLGQVGDTAFAVLLPLADADGAAAMAGRLRAAIASHRASDLAEPSSVTASIGAATLDAAMAGADDLIRAAEAALERAKADAHDRLSPVNPSLRRAA